MLRWHNVHADVDLIAHLQIQFMRGFGYCCSLGWGALFLGLTLLLPVVSSFRDRSLPDDMVAFGEVGLAGEIRPVPNGQERIREAAKHGFKRAIVPAANVPRQKIKGMEIVAVRKITEALEALI
jgi:predicted ATP-dependent serine protease